MALNHDHQGRRRPHKDALFSLLPDNGKALSVVEAEDNDHLVSFSWNEGLISFDIGFHINSQHSTNTLVTFGRDLCDISLKPQSISKFHCSLEIDDLDTGIVMLYDRSHSLGTQVFGEQSQHFERGRSPRKVLVHPDNTNKISMGGKNNDLIQFKIEWILDEYQIREVARKHRDAGKDLITNPRKAQTRDETDTVLPSAQITPDQAFIKPTQLGLRYFQQGLLGLGSYGKVWRVIGFDCGRVMAMKRIDRVPGEQEQVQLAKVRGEVELMRLAKHPNIADLITSQGWGDRCSTIEIFMGVEKGSVNDLSNSHEFTLHSGRPERCLKQMLSALSFLAAKGIVHRDVKPDNILYSQVLEGPGYDFRLADFGTGKLAKLAYSCQGTHWYMAPEILKHRNRADADSKIREQQSPKVDVWSLFVAIAFARDVCHYRERDLNTNDHILDAVREACKETWMSKYSAMAIENPDDRASACDILIQHFDEVVDWEGNDIEMYEDKDEALMDPRPAQHAPLVLKPEKNLRNGHHFRVEKKKQPCHARTRLAWTT